jgi:cell division protein FtsL
MSGGHRMPRIGTARFVMAMVFVMVALAVTLQAQRVTGQNAIEELLAETTDAGRQGAELRAQVAEAESPSEVLTAAKSMGMVQPAAVVAVPVTAGNEGPAQSGGTPVG